MSENLGGPGVPSASGGDRRGHSPPEGQDDQGTTGARRPLVDVLVYVAARLALVVVLSAAIYGVARLLGVGDFPIYIAVAFAIVIAMPLGIWVFAPLRRRATTSIAAIDERRRRDRERLRARLRGEAQGRSEATRESAPEDAAE